MRTGKLKMDISIREVDNEDYLIDFQEGEVYTIIHEFLSGKMGSGKGYVIFDGHEAISVDSKFVEVIK